MLLCFTELNCHCGLLFNVRPFVYLSFGLIPYVHLSLALKDGAKVQGWQKTNSGIAGLRGDKRGYGRIKGDAGWNLEGWKGAKMRGLTPILVKIGMDGVIKKPLKKRLRSFMEVIPKDYINESLLIFVPLKNGRVHRRLFQQLHLRKSPYVFFRQLLSHEKITP